MFRGSAGVRAVLVMALMLGGCAKLAPGAAHLPYPGDSIAVADAVPLQQAPPPIVEAPPVVAAAVADDALHAQPQGYIINRPAKRPYLLDTGDRVRVFVYGQPNLSRLYPVDHDGRIVVPLIGSVRARGLTTTQLGGAIRSRLGAQYVRDPQVTVDINLNRPFFILGEVRSPGQYPYVSGMTVETAVAIAGGYGERASERHMRLKRRSGDAIETIKVDPNFEVEPGDTIYVKERFF